MWYTSGRPRLHPRKFRISKNHAGIVDFSEIKNNQGLIYLHSKFSKIGSELLREGITFTHRHTQTLKHLGIIIFLVQKNP